MTVAQLRTFLGNAEWIEDYVVKIVNALIERLIIAPTTLMSILIMDAYGLDQCSRAEVIREQGYWSPFLQGLVDVKSVP